MQQLIETHCKGAFRSYKTFHATGRVLLHTRQEFQEWEFKEDHILTIIHYRHPRKKLICETDQWTFGFENKQHFIKIAQPPAQYEIISVNHTGLVIADNDRGEKTFLARLPVWQNLIKSLPIF